MRKCFAAQVLRTYEPLPTHLLWRLRCGLFEADDLDLNLSFATSSGQTADLSGLSFLILR